MENLNFARYRCHLQLNGSGYPSESRITDGKRVITPALSGATLFSGYPVTSDGIMKHSGRLYLVN
jgi:hypothetical protein